MRIAGFKGKASPSAGNIGYAENQAPTLIEGQVAHVVYETHENSWGGVQVCVLNDQGGSVMDVSEIAGCLRAQEHGHQPIICYEVRNE